MKKLFVVMACLAFAGALQAQSLLTKGNPYATNVRTGNRPGAGDWGLYIGPSYSEAMDLVDCFANFTNLDVVRGLPLVNVKYYTSDNLEFRGGIQYYKRGFRASGNEILTPTTDKEHSMKESEWFFRLIPGFAYHFSPRNVLDVYTGVSLPLGFEGSTYKDEYVNPDAVNGVFNQYRKSLCVGLEAFIGLQAFIADLPVSVGFEYGLSGMFHTGQKVKTEVYDAVNNTTQTTYQLLGDPTDYKDLKANSGVFGSDLRLTITYYFNNK